MDPSFALGKAIIARLKADAGVFSFVEGRVYDRVSETAAFPYVSLGGPEVEPELADCYNGSIVDLTIHVWSRSVGQIEAMKISDAVAKSLHDADFALDGHRLVSIERDGTRYLGDPDPNTTHAVLSFTAQTEPID